MVKINISTNEERFVILGLSTIARLLSFVIVFDKRKVLLESFPLEKQRKENQSNIMVVTMKKEYDFSKGKKNSYITSQKKQVTIRLDAETINYFKHLSEDNGIPYQTLINLYLRDCAQKHKKLNMGWAPSKR